MSAAVPGRPLRIRAWLCAGALACGACISPAWSADPWAGAGDAALRHDLQLLADAGLVKAPLTAWPVSWAEVARDLAAAGDSAGLPAHVDAALGRVQARARAAGQRGEIQKELRLAGAEEPMRLRRFGDVPREQAELEGGLQHTGRHFAWRLQGALVADPADDQDFRPDGSYLAASLGNWSVAAGWQDRWWGPGWEGSLVYGSNARPIPALTIERELSDPFETKWLAWLGQWRLHATFGWLDEDREDFEDVRFFAMRLTWKPHERVEIGLSRSAQWCGEGRPCGFDTFWDLFWGNDNDQPLEEQPGNQMAGFDARWSLPWLPLAVYGQAIGEDEAGGFPSKYLGLAGLETWGGLGERSWRVHVEYADTACVFNEAEPEFGCAYQNVIYTDGYQFRNRSIGHAVDGDSEQIAFGAQLVNADGSRWELAGQNAKLNRASANLVHSVSPVAARSRSLDLYYRRGLLGGDLGVGLGVEDFDPDGAGDDTRLRGYLQWSRRWP